MLLNQRASKKRENAEPFPHVGRGKEDNCLLHSDEGAPPAPSYGAYQEEKGDLISLRGKD